MRLNFGYQGQSSPSLNQYHQRECPSGRKTHVGGPSAPARWAVVLLTVMTASQALISAASPSMSLVLSMSSRCRTCTPQSTSTDERSADVSPYCKSTNR